MLLSVGETLLRREDRKRRVFKEAEMATDVAFKCMKNVVDENDDEDNIPLVSNDNIAELQTKFSIYFQLCLHQPPEKCYRHF